MGLKKGLESSIWAAAPSKLSTKPRFGTVRATTTTTTTTTTTAIKPAAAPVERAFADTSANGPNGNTSTNTSMAESSPAKELTRYSQIARRMLWKLPALEHGYSLVMEARRDPTRSSAEEEIMFKLDFFEYYMLLERALVHLLGVFGITVKAGAALANGSTNGRRTAAATATGTGTHAYHHNVIAALESLDNPLHEILGHGPVRRHLLRAKELRNKWKYAEGHGDGGGGAAGDDEIAELSRMLREIFDAFGRAYGRAQRHVEELGCRMDLVEGERARPGESESESDGEDWGFMVDAMDWEAV